MNTKEAADILRQHNAWRRNMDDDSPMVMQSPRLIGEAIDVAVRVMEELNDAKVSA